MVAGVQDERAEPLVGERRAEFAAELAALYTSDKTVTVRELMARTGQSYGLIYRLLTVDAGVQLRPRGVPYGWRPHDSQKRW